MPIAGRSAYAWAAPVALGLALTIGCAAPEPTEEEAARETPAPVSEPAPAETSAATIPVMPTAEGDLPEAIVGTAAAPQGIDLEYMTGDPATVGYLAVPEGQGPFPALILVHEWDGLNDRIRQTADAFAAEGYIALAADLYQGRTGSNREENMALVSEVRGNMDQVVTNLNTAASYLRGREDTSGRIGVMGWCFGGGVALSYGLDGENHDATAIFYGTLVQDPELLAGLGHEVYGTFAANDTGIPPADVEQFVEALRTAGIENDVHVYDDMDHGFWLYVDEEPETRTAPALDAWERLKAYLSRTLSSGPQPTE